MNSNRTVVDLNKVSYANFYWATKDNSIRRDKKPTGPTVNGTPISKDSFAPAVERDGAIFYPRESLLDRAKRRGLLDEWGQHCILQLSNSHSLHYTGKKAQAIWREWNRRQFNKKGK